MSQIAEPGPLLLRLRQTQSVVTQIRLHAIWSLADFPKNPRKALDEIRAALSSRKQVALLNTELSKALATLHQKVKGFILQVSDFVRLNLLPKQEAFRVLKRTLNFAPLKLQLARFKHDNASKVLR